MTANMGPVPIPQFPSANARAWYTNRILALRHALGTDHTDPINQALQAEINLLTRAWNAELTDPKPPDN